MKLRMAKAPPDRRVSHQCPFCKGVVITQETTVKSTKATRWWRCLKCQKGWAERRTASA
jgi:hypothetical protein